MKFCPRYSYIFNSCRTVGVRTQVPLIRYLNDHGQVPYTIIGEPEVEECFAAAGLRWRSVRHVPADGQVMLAEACGYIAPERHWLQESMQAGKYNFAVLNGILNNRRHLGPLRMPRLTKAIHGMCARDRRTADVFLQENKEVIYPIVGNPSWDYFSTPEFSAAVAAARRDYGDRLLVIGLVYLIDETKHFPERETAFYRSLISKAESLGFRVIVRPHPGYEERVPPELAKYQAPDIHRHVLFAAASHLLAFLESTICAEAALLGTRVGAFPVINNHPRPYYVSWFERPQDWRQAALEDYGPELVERVPLIFDEQSLEFFLRGRAPCVSAEELDAIYGWPKVECYCEYFFETLELLIAGYESGERTAPALTQRVLNLSVFPDIVKTKKSVRFEALDYWIEEKAGEYRLDDLGRAPERLLAEAQDLLRDNKPGAAALTLRRAGFLGDTSAMAPIFSLMSLAALQQGNLEEARKFLYQSELYSFRPFSVPDRTAGLPNAAVLIYGSGDGLEASIKSALEQDYPRLQRLLIVGDNRPALVPVVREMLGCHGHAPELVWLPSVHSLPVTDPHELILCCRSGDVLVPYALSWGAQCLVGRETSIAFAERCEVHPNGKLAASSQQVGCRFDYLRFILRTASLPASPAFIWGVSLQMLPRLAEHEAFLLDEFTFWLLFGARQPVEYLPALLAKRPAGRSVTSSHSGHGLRSDYRRALEYAASAWTTGNDSARVREAAFAALEIDLTLEETSNNSFSHILPHVAALRQGLHDQPVLDLLGEKIRQCCAPAWLCFEHAQNILNEGKCLQALELLDTLTPLDVWMPGLHLTIAVALAASGHSAAALEAIERELRLHPADEGLRRLAEQTRRALTGLRP